MPYTTAKERRLKHFNNTIKLITENNPHLSPITVKSYAQRLRSAFEMVYPDKVYKKVNYVWREPSLVIHKLNNSDIPISTIMTTYTAILSVYKKGATGKLANGLPQFKKQMAIYSLKVKEKYMKQNKSVKEEKNWVENDKLKSMLNEYKPKNDLEKFRKFIISLLVLLPPRRALDYGIMRINGVQDKDRNNCVVKDGKFQEFVFNKYKGSDKKGSQTITRDDFSNLKNGDEILEVLDQWVSTNGTGWFLNKERSTNLMTKTVTNASKQIFGKPITVNDYRHMYISAFMNSDNWFLDEKMKIAKMMAHHVATQEIYRKRE